MPNLAKRQEDALQAISNPLNQYGVAPTHRELMEELGLRSTSSVKGLLRNVARRFAAYT
ncbi:LexA family protein [Bacillus atrophaeus]|uniref:LexA family protein n=1 Tax=Bacillus atrophaeus TaxID=1452 RepID=UPI00227FCD3E|nr:transcriptional regulator [Bacillus atrophaeus]MCY8932974.1 transcriptional regulator [Bacillus atrophaeus]MCY8940478.1 transcriptional regulator [Bacillus atrophaeus]MCY8944963.1 transcriptional regulator [Bacillus atrophaeus]